LSAAQEEFYWMPRLRPFQREDVDAIKASNLRTILASSPGTGKTPIAVVALLETGRWSLPALVVCPASVTINWKREFKTWAHGLRVQIVGDMSTPLDKNADVYVTSWALLDPREMEFHGRKLKAIVADEAHLAKNPDALRSQALYRLTRGRKGILLLTGTPIVNSQEELGTLNALYGTPPPMIRRLLEDVAPEIPPKKRSYLYVRVRERAQAEYDRAFDDFELWLTREKERLLGEGMADAAVERAMAAEAFTKMGYLRRLIGEAKVPAAADWIARAVRIGEPVVVFVEHQVVLKKLVKSLRAQRIRHVVVEGKTSPKKRQRYIDQFQANQFPVIVCTKAGKEGITLHSARHLLFIERFFTSADEEQAEDRIRRIGQTHKTTIWYLHAAGTIDERLDTIVRSKRIIIRNAIRAENTGETTIANVELLVRSWNSFVAKERAVTALGRGDPLPPLPGPSNTHAVVFYGDRWKVRSAAAWCRMHGYLPSAKVGMADRFKLIVHPIEVFRPREFTSVTVCQDVKVIVGKRLSARNEKQMRARLQRMKG
jgi:SWI/SNF-related matrix-associated actin-dependent regulator of chromatin subfamily A-like protein 1